MKISKQAQRDARQLFQSCLVNGFLDEARVRQATTLVLEQKPRRYMQVLSRFTRLVKLELDRHSASIESAIPLTPELQSEVTARIKGIYGNGLEIAFRQNPALLGGLRIKVGSDLYDGSVRTRLEQLEQSF